MAVVSVKYNAPVRCKNGKNLKQKATYPRLLMDQCLEEERASATARSTFPPKQPLLGMSLIMACKFHSSYNVDHNVYAEKQNRMSMKTKGKLFPLYEHGTLSHL